MSEAFGTWRLEGLIAVGGLGEVWKAQRDSTLVALKRLHTHLARNDEARAQFAIEQMLAATLPPHPNVIHGVEFGDVEGRPYVALELVGGEDLRRIVAPPVSRTDSAPARVLIPRRRALEIVAAACEASTHLHTAGWVHGDINPGNLMIEGRPGGDRVVLIDLGVARQIGGTGSVRGTHAYMAPEQVRGEAWTAATDVFALGVVLWELATGDRLFHRGPPWLSMAAVVEAPAPALSDPALDAVVQAALTKDPARRLQDARDLRDQIRTLS